MSMLDGVFGILRTIASGGSAVPSRATIDFTDGLQAIDDADNGKTLVSLRADTRTALVNALTAGAYDGEKRHCDGYYARGDGGGGMFVWDEDNVDTAVPGMVIGTGTGRWVRVFEGPVNVRWFGAKGDGIVDDQPAIQRAIWYAHTARIATVYLPQGRYRTTKTIHLAVPPAIAPGFQSLCLQGDGARYRGESGFPGTAIVADFSDQPAINIQGGRQCSVRGLALLGLNRTFYESNGHGQYPEPGLLDTSLDAWDNPALHPSANSRYAPYAAISIDGWSGSAPGTTEAGTAYPVDEYPYGQAFSGSTLIEDCGITGFVVGVVNQPCDADGNADFTKIRRCTIEMCKWGVSIGNTQARNTAAYDTEIALVHTMLTTRHHGRQNGKVGGVWHNVSGGAAIQVFDLHTTSICGPIEFVNFYCESTWRIGDILLPTAIETSVTFRGCQFDLTGQASEIRGIPATILGTAPLQSDGVIVFDGGSITNFRGAASIMLHGVQFRGTVILENERNTDDAIPAYLCHAHNALAGGVCLPQLFPGDMDQSFHFDARLPSSGLRDSGHIWGQYTRWADRTRCLPLWIQSAKSGATAVNPAAAGRYIVPGRVSFRAKSSLSSCTFTQNSTKPGELTLVFSSLPDWQADLYGFMPGDVIWDDETGLVFAIRSRSTVTVVAELLCGYRYDDDTSTYVCQDDAVFSESVGNLYFANSRVYTPTYPTLATGSTGSPTPDTLTAVGRADGWGGYLTADVLVGDRLVVDELSDGRVAATAGLISNVNAGANTITIAAAPNRNFTSEPMPWFVRAAPANRGTR